MDGVTGVVVTHKRAATLAATILRKGRGDTGFRYVPCHHIAKRYLKAPTNSARTAIAGGCAAIAACTETTPTMNASTSMSN